MLISDLLEDINKFSESEIEFHIVNSECRTTKLNLFIGPSGEYLFKKKDNNNNNTIVLGLEEPDA